MESASHCRLLLVTAPDVEVARALARGALEARLVACANLVAGVESHYWWEGRLDSSAEVLLLLKTTEAALPELERLLLAEHPYDTPEIVSVALDGSTPRYLRWLLESVGRGG